MGARVVTGALWALIIAGIVTPGRCGANPAPALAFSIAPIQPSEDRFQNVEPVKINDAGDVLCRAFPDPQSDFLHVEPFIWTGGHSVPVGLVPYGLSNNGLVVGLRFDQDDPAAQDMPMFAADSALWRAGQMTQIPAAAFARDVNDRGQVVGAVVGRLPVQSRAYLWQDGRSTDLPTMPGCATSTADAINEAGEIAGDCGRVVVSGHLKITLIYPCVWQNNRCHRIPGLVGREVEHVPAVLRDVLRPGAIVQRRYAINDHGDVMIHWDVISSSGVDGETFLYAGGRLTPISGMACAYDINDADQIVGETFHDCATHAALWEKGRIYELDAMLPSGSPWRLESARTINNRGVIAGTAHYDGRVEAFVISDLHDTPAPTIAKPATPSTDPREAKSADS